MTITHVVCRKQKSKAMYPTVGFKGDHKKCELMDVGSNIIGLQQVDLRRSERLALHCAYGEQISAEAHA